MKITIEADTKAAMDAARRLARAALPAVQWIVSAAVVVALFVVAMRLKGYA